MTTEDMKEQLLATSQNYLSENNNLTGLVQVTGCLMALTTDILKKADKNIITKDVKMAIATTMFDSMMEELDKIE